MKFYLALATRAYNWVLNDILNMNQTENIKADH